MKSACIQLAEETHGYTLEDARTALVSAVQLDESRESPLRELGWFTFNIENDADQAVGLFEESLDSSIAHLVDALSGYMKAKKELEPDFNTAAFATDLFAALANHPTLQEM